MLPTARAGPRSILQVVNSDETTAWSSGLLFMVPGEFFNDPGESLDMVRHLVPWNHGRAGGRA